MPFTNGGYNVEQTRSMTSLAQKLTVKSIEEYTGKLRFHKTPSQEKRIDTATVATENKTSRNE